MIWKLSYPVLGGAGGGDTLMPTRQMTLGLSRLRLFGSNTLRGHRFRKLSATTPFTAKQDHKHIGKYRKTLLTRG
jgi:hypothetical protein